MSNATRIKGSKGCFAAGSKVYTPLGQRNIEELKVGDEVFSYNDIGDVEVDVITAVHHHEPEEVYFYTFWGADDEFYTLNATPSHWVLNQYGAFVPVGTLELDDCVVDVLGHLRPLMDVEQGDVQPVYNLSVEKNRTFIVNGLRVHNQGTGARHPKLRGSKGKASGGRAAVEDPNTLRSRATIKTLELISQGEVYGLVNKTNPLKSVYFDDTPLMNADGSLNFGNCYAEERVGTSAQTYIQGFPSANNPVQVGVTVTATTPVTRTVNADIDAVRVTIGLNALYQQNKETGDTKGYSVDFRIQTKLSTSMTWVTSVNKTINGKTMRPYERDYRVPRPTGAGSWDVRVVRVSPDDTDSAKSSVISFARYVELKDAKLTYPNWAVIGVAADAESTGGSIPKVSFDVRGILCKVPSNYNPLTRQYTGAWNGTFSPTLQWTDNPAWILYDLLTNFRYGMGEYITEAMIDRYSFYDAAVYNDQLVPFTNQNGVTTQGVRFTFNGPIQSREDAWKVIQSIASCCNAFVGEAGGYITLIQDRPKNPKKLVTPANVINGKFTYSSTNILARHTACNVTFNDPTDNYLPRTVTEKLVSAIGRYGYNPTDLVAFGCTNEAQARRAAKWLLETENSATHILTYQASWDHIDTVPGDIIKVADPSISGYNAAGRIVSATSGQALLDRDIDHSAPGTYTIDLTLPDGSIVTRNITGWSTVDGKTQVTFASTGTVVATESVYAITGPATPRQFRILSQKEDKPGLYTVTAILHDPTKYARIETGVAIPAPTYSVIGKNVPKAPTNLLVAEESYYDSMNIRRRLRISWKTDGADFIVDHTLKYSVDDKAFITISGITQPEYLLENVNPGKYTFSVICHNAVNMSSPPANTSYTINTGENGTAVQASSLKAPTNIGVDLGTGNGPTRITRFWNDDVLIGWDDPTDNVNLTGGVTDITSAYYIEFIRPDDTIFHTATIYKPSKTYQLMRGTNTQRFSTSGIPTGVFKVRMACIDAFGRMGVKSLPVIIQVLSMNAPSNILNAVSNNTAWESGDLSIRWDCYPNGYAPLGSTNIHTLPLFKQYNVTVKDSVTGEVYKQTTTLDNKFTWSLAENLSFPTPTTSAQISITADDDYGNTSPLNSQTFIATAPGAVSSLALVGGGTIFNTRDIAFEWTCPVSLTDNRKYSSLNVFNYFEVKVQKTDGSYVIYTTKNESFTYTFEQNVKDNGAPNKAPNITITAVDVFGRRGASITQTFTAITPPSVTNLQMVNNGGTVFVTQDLSVAWSCGTPPLTYSTLPIFDCYEVKVRSLAGVLKRTVTSSTEDFSYLFTDNTLDFGGTPARQFSIEVAAKDVFGQYGSSAVNTFNNPAPAAPGIAFQAGYNIQHFTIQAPTDPDISGYQVYISKTNGFLPPDQGTLVYDGANLFGNFPVEPNTTYYARAACYDVYSKSGLSWSPIISFSTLQDVKANEYKVYGITFTPDPATNKVSWTSGTLAKVGDTSPKTISSGISGAWSSGVASGGPMFIYAVWPNTALQWSYDLSAIYTSNPGGTVTILGVYRGGTDLTQGDGRVMMDGGYLLAQTVGTSQLMAGSVTATQVGANTIISQAANINDAVITNAKLVDLTVDTIKLKNGAITNITGVNASLANIGVSQFTPLNQRLPNGTSSYLDSGWQTVATHVIYNPPATAGTNLSGASFISFGVSFANGLTSNGGGGNKPYWQENINNEAGSHSFRLVFEAQDMNDGQWYEQGINNSYWPYSSARGARIRQFTGDDPTMFNGMLKFNTIQNQYYGGAATQSQGTYYRPNQAFRIKLQIRASVYTGAYSLENFTSYALYDGGYVPYINTIPTPTARYKFWLVETSTGIKTSDSTAYASLAYADYVGNIKVNSGYIVVQQVFK